MTVREMLKLKTLMANLAIYIGFTLASMSILYQKSTRNEDASIATMVGFSLFLIGLLYGYYAAARCPSCRSSLYYLFLKYRAALWLSVDIQYCPCCSLNLDEEWTGQKSKALALPDKPSAAQSEAEPNQEVSALLDDAAPRHKTGRELITERTRFANIFVWTGTGLVMAGILLDFITGNHAWLLVLGPGFIFLLYGNYYGNALAYRCPWCNHHLSNWLTHRSGWWLADDFKICPYCARKFDDEVKDQTATTKALTRYPE